MAMPNLPLEIALAWFAAQPGVTPDHQAQLRAAVCANEVRLERLNRQAAAGRLNGFSLDVAAGDSNLTGRYDKQAGVVSLPVADFGNGRELEAALGVQAITVEFAHARWRKPGGGEHVVDQDMLNNLQSTLNGSPVLAGQIKQAVMQGHVGYIGLLDAPLAAAAVYDGQVRDGTPKGIRLAPSGLQSNTAATPEGRFDARDMTFVLGHEIQHGVNNAAKQRATGIFLDAIAARARAPGIVHDHTDALRAYLQAGREDEAKAQIAGWNALLSREKVKNPKEGGLQLMAFTQMQRIYDFIKPIKNKSAPQQALPGLTFNSDGSLSQTEGNIAAMGRHYFDRPSPRYARPGQRPMTLGEHRDMAGNPRPSADYPTYYATWALERIIAAEDRAHAHRSAPRAKIAIDMAGLGLKEDLIEMEGLDLGRDKTPRPYLDTSRTPPAEGRFHHTQDGSVDRRHDHQHVPAASTTHAASTDGGSLDRWVGALRSGDQAAIAAARQALTASPQARRLWNEALAEVHAGQTRLSAWQVRAWNTSLFRQAMAQLDRLGSSAELPAEREQRERVAAALAVQARQSGLPAIDAVRRLRDGGLVAAWRDTRAPTHERRTPAINPIQAAKQPLQHSMQRLHAQMRGQPARRQPDSQPPARALPPPGRDRSR